MTLDLKTKSFLFSNKTIINVKVLNISKITVQHFLFWNSNLKIWILVITYEKHIVSDTSMNPTRK